MALPTPMYTTPYCDQVKAWPPSGRHILAQYDADTIIVYQAYSPSIGRFAIEHGHFGGDFKYTRMSWIKPNFLWMMYRSDWGRSEGQQVVLAIRPRRSFFDSLLDQAIPSSFSSKQFDDHAAWKSAVEKSDVRLQWAPDHLPVGEPTNRRAIQLGLRGQVLEAYGKKEIVEIIDMSDFIVEQRANVDQWRTGALLTPTELPYVPAASLADHIGLDLPD